MRAKPVEVKLDPIDNQRLARLCGTLDENLRQIESALDVTIARRGARFTVRGEQASRAAQALEHFYDRASGELTLDDVQLGLTELLQGKSVPPAVEGPRSRPESAWASCRATSRRRSIHTCGRCMTHCSI